MESARGSEILDFVGKARTIDAVDNSLQGGQNFEHTAIDETVKFRKVTGSKASRSLGC